MRSAAKIVSEIKALQEELEQIEPYQRMGVRELARAAGVSPTTSMRFKHGKEVGMTALKKLLPFTHRCPLCRSRQ